MTRRTKRALAGLTLGLAVLTGGAAGANPVLDERTSSVNTVQVPNLPPAQVPEPPPGPGGYLCPYVVLEGNEIEVCVPAP